jgi:2'-5' RNA ligase
MEYDIVYLLKGDAAKYQQHQVKELAARFDEPYLLEKRRPAHVTLKYSFPASRIKEIEAVVARIARNRAPRIKIRRHITFHNRVICLKVEFSKEANKLYDELRRDLKKIEWLQWKDTDNLKGIFHAALIYTSSLKSFKEAKTYLAKEKPAFDLKLDNITIRRRKDKNERWRVHKIYKLEDA